MYFSMNILIKNSLINQLWWKFMPGTRIKVKWPDGEVRIRQEESDLWDYKRALDPNDAYRPWMEENVGMQGWDWDWKVGPSDTFIPKTLLVGASTVVIKFRKKKAKFATLAQLMWG